MAPGSRRKASAVWRRDSRAIAYKPPSGVGQGGPYTQSSVQTPTLVYDILPPTTATGLEKKLSANEQFFDDAQTAASL